MEVNDFINKYDPMSIDLIGMDHLTYDLYRVMSNGYESKYWGIQNKDRVILSLFFLIMLRKYKYTLKRGVIR